ncbi:MAG: methionyl-tRNA formyltransferase [Acidobacteriota bacterium]|nr:methionyl-tRNA formyltransferase [Acidobacteriota bacterium]
MRVLFLGTPDFARTFLEALAQNQTRLGLRLAGVVTQPDRKSGRGRKLSPPPVKVAALQFGLPIFQCARIRGDAEALEFLRQARPDVMVVVAFGQILPREFFAWPRFGSLNVHTSLLPRYRGAAPVVHAILNGEKETGVTIMKLDEGMDTGDVLAQSTTPIGPDVTSGDLERQLSRQGVELLLGTLPSYLSGELQARPQDHERAILAPLIRKDDARIDWTRPACRIHDQIRAFNPRPGAFTCFRGERLKIWRSRNPHASAFPVPDGRIRTTGKGSILVGCGQGTSLELLELQLANRGRLRARDFTNGMTLRSGERLGVGG